MEKEIYIPVYKCNMCNLEFIDDSNLIKKDDIRSSGLESAVIRHTCTPTGNRIGLAIIIGFRKMIDEHEEQDLISSNTTKECKNSPDGQHHFKVDESLGGQYYVLLGDETRYYLKEHMGKFFSIHDGHHGCVFCGLSRP